MFKTILIKNFKSINSLEIKNLANVNLFFGKNNCGKSTLLEAIFLITGISNPELLRRCNFFRGYKYFKDFSFFFHNLNTSSPILLDAKSNISYFNRKASFEFSEKTENSIIVSNDHDNSITNLNTTSFLNVSFSVSNKEVKNSRVSLSANKEKEVAEVQIPTFYKENIICNYLSPIFSFETIPPMVNKVLRDKQEEIVIDALRMIDKRINDFVLFENEVMVDVGLDKRIPINLLGDGVRKFFTLILAIYSSKDGVLIVDEIDNGLHYSSMENLWNIVLETSEKFNVQLFISTHNVDSLKGLRKTLENKDKYMEKVSLFKLIHNSSDENKAVYYDAESFSTVIEQENEIR